VAAVVHPTSALLAKRVVPVAAMALVPQPVGQAQQIKASQVATATQPQATTVVPVVVVAHRR
jgi:hypothetical protein